MNQPRVTRPNPPLGDGGPASATYLSQPGPQIRRERGRSTPPRGHAGGVPRENQRARREVEWASIRGSKTNPTIGASPAATTPRPAPLSPPTPPPVVPVTNLTAACPSKVGPIASIDRSADHAGLSHVRSDPVE